MRKINERQIGPFALEHFCGSTCDPSCAGQSSQRSPERRKGKCSELLFQPVCEASWRTGDAERLTAVGAIVGFWRDANLAIGALIELPEQFGRPKLPPRMLGLSASGCIQRFRLNQTVRLLPEPYLVCIAI